MEVDVLAGFGVGFLGSRLKRLAERMQADAAEVARSLGLPVQPAQMSLLMTIRLHGPITLIEYDNTQNDANHIHSIWHDLTRNWGRDLLREHYESGHAHR